MATDPRSKILDTAAQPPQKMVKARVRPGGQYMTGDRTTGARTQHHEGDVVDVTEREYAAAKHALVTDEDAAKEKAAAVEAAKPKDDPTALFRAFRHRARAASAQAKAAQDAKFSADVRRVLEAAGQKG